MTREEYLREVAWELRDLPWRKRRELVADLRSHLDEVPPEQLAPPKAYVAELRDAEGLERRHGVVAFLRARRPRSLAIVAALLVLVALLASAYAWVESYQPLVHGYGETGPGGESLTTESLVTFHDGRPFVFGPTVRNDGSFSVRVEDVPFVEPDSNQPFSGRIMMSGVLKNGGVYPPYVPFRPFDLKPGQERLLYFQGRFANCRAWAGGTGTEITSFPVTFSFLWRRQTVELPLFKPVVIHFPLRRRCLPKR